jgi:hypothetical protein
VHPVSNGTRFIGRRARFSPPDNFLGRLIAGFALTLAIFAAGCATAPPSSERPTAPAADLRDADRTPAIRAAAERELGPDVAATMPALPPADLKPPDAGAAQLVSLFAAAPKVADSSSRRIKLAKIRNLSRATDDEFRRMVDRLTAMLEDAGEDAALAFTNDPAAPADFELSGSAYLVVGQGFELWELFLTLRPVNGGCPAWERSKPIYLFRQPVPGGPQLLVD